MAGVFRRQAGPAGRRPRRAREAGRGPGARRVLLRARDRNRRPGGPARGLRVARESCRPLGFGVWPLFADPGFDGPAAAPHSSGSRTSSGSTRRPYGTRRTSGAPRGGGRRPVRSGPRAVEEADPAEVHGLVREGRRGRGERLPRESRLARRRSAPNSAASSGPAGAAERGWLMIPSGGAGGGLKFARHDGWTIAAAVDGFCRHFGMERVNSVCVLPLHHVSGFMAWMRSALTGGRSSRGPGRTPRRGAFPPTCRRTAAFRWCPTQLQRLLASDGAVAWLRRFRIVFLGGGPAWDGLLDEAARLELPLSPSYGATETAAMVAALEAGAIPRGPARVRAGASPRADRHRRRRWCGSPASRSSAGTFPEMRGRALVDDRRPRGLRPRAAASSSWAGATTSSSRAARRCPPPRSRRPCARAGSSTTSP